MLSSNEKIKFRILLCIVLFMIPVVIYIICGLYYVQIMKHEDFLLIAKKIYTTTLKKEGKRGEIFFHDKGKLVANEPYARVIADATLMEDSPKHERLSAQLCSEMLGLNYQTVYDKLFKKIPIRDKKNKYILDGNGKPKMRRAPYIILAPEIPHRTAKAFEEQISKREISGLRLEYYDKRDYPKGTTLAPILGITNWDSGRYVPQFGLEKAFDHHLSPTSSSAVVEIGRDGRKLTYGLSEQLSIKDGKNVYLTIREPIQAIIEDELDKFYNADSCEAVYAILIDPKTGNIWGMSQRPTFNPNDRSTLKPSLSRTRIIEDVMEPGSIMKPFTVAYALDNGYVTPDTIIDCHKGYWLYMKRPLTDSHSIGKVSVSEVVKQSSNIGTAKIALMLGADNVYDNLFKFGFGQKTGIPLSPESSGTLHPVRKWDGLSITRIPIGYSVNVTPVQMVRAYGALADNGNLRKLRLVDRIEDPETNEIIQMPYEAPVQMFKRAATSEQISAMLHSVTGRGGTAREAAIDGYQVAGKTGTARKHIQGQGYSMKKYFASFVGYVPIEKPAFVLLVTVDTPKTKSIYGGRVAGPLFHKIALRTLKYLDIKPTEPVEPQKNKR